MSDTVLDALHQLEGRVSSITPSGRNAKGFLHNEMQALHAIQRLVRQKYRQRYKRNVVVFLCTALPTAALYIALFFVLLPHNAFHMHQVFYLAVAGSLFVLWLLWALVLLATFRYLCITYLFPYMQTHPTQAKSTAFSANSLFIFICMNPLFQLANLAARIVRPSWETFFSSLVAVIVQAAISNPFTAFVNMGAFLTIVFGLYGFLQKRHLRRKEKLASAAQRQV